MNLKNWMTANLKNWMTANRVAQIALGKHSPVGLHIEEFPSAKDALRVVRLEHYMQEGDEAHVIYQVKDIAAFDQLIQEMRAWDTERILTQPEQISVADGIKTATGAALDSLGSMFGHIRNSGEPDTNFRKRLTNLLSNGWIGGGVIVARADHKHRVTPFVVKGGTGGSK